MRRSNSSANAGATQVGACTPFVMERMRYSGNIVAETIWCRIATPFT